MTDINTDWQELVIPDFLGGLDKSQSRSRLADNSLSDCKNVIIDQGVLTTDWGYTTYLSTVEGTPRATIRFEKKSGAVVHCLITNTRFYIEVSDEWQYVSDGTSTTCTDGEPAGETNIVVGSISGFSDADVVGIILDNGTQHQTTINGAPSGSTIVITDAIPVGRSVSVGAAFIKATVLTGTNDDAVSYTIMASDDWVVFTNNTDNVKRYDGTDVTDVPNLPSSGNCKAKIVRVVENHLTLLNTTEGGTAYPQRVRYSDTGDPTNWSTGNAGYEDLYKDAYHITAAEHIGPYLIIYKTHSISRMEYIGADDLLFTFEATVTDDGCRAVNGVIKVKDYHIVVGQSNIYEYRGGFDLDPIGNNIDDLLLGVNGELSATYQSTMFCVFSSELNNVWIVYPAGASTTPNTALQYSLQDKGWTYRQYDGSFIFAASYIDSDTKSWLELTGNWEDQTWFWNSRSVASNAPVILLCGTDANQIYSYNYVAADDNGTDIDWEITTKEFMHSQYNMRIDSIVVNVKNTVLVEYSTDGGSNWYTYGERTSGSTWEMYRIYKQLVARSIMFKLSGTGSVSNSRMVISYRLEDVE